MKFNHYKLEDFLSDKDFIDWAKGGESLEGHIYFSQWINSRPENLNEALLAREIILSLKCDSLTPGQEDYNEVFSAIISHKYKENSTRQPSGKTRYFVRINPAWIRVAVVLLAVTVIAVLFKLNESSKTPEPVTYSEVIRENPRGQRTRFQLPDGSAVWLNAESQVRYVENFGEGNRLLELKGEAFFEVKHDTLYPFVVKSGPLTTTALGTAFDVNAFDVQKGIEVSLVDGKVEVENTLSNRKVVLKPGEKAVGNSRNSELKKSAFHYDEMISWKDGIIFFTNADLEQVIARLERWYNVKISIINYPADQWAYNGSFNNMSLSQVLARMSFTEDFEYEMNNKNVTLKFNSGL
jgi:ferric-dicitrate binding protein FerR (iron transport regulator)